MNIKVSDPLSLLPYQAGLTGDSLVDEAGQGNTSLDVKQKACEIGQPVPIVFGRRVTVGSDEVGGVFVAPPATSGRYENDSTTNVLTVNLQLILSQGQIGDIKENQVYQRACRVGTWKRAYNQRASSWVPGNHIVTVSNKEPWDCPSYCGTDSKFTDLTCLSYTNTHADNDKTFDKQVYVFVENGLKVTRILDSQLGSSNNFIDLAIYLIKQSRRLPNDMIDTTSMTAAANFLNTNNFLCNGVFDKSENLEDWLTKTGNLFLLRLSEKDGKKCFKPRLPVNADHSINSTNAIVPSFSFTEDHVLDGSFQIEYIPITERQDACALVLWRQQPDNDIGIVRTSEIKQTGVTDPVIIQYDLSQWCCSESHAVKYGAYQIARRKYITHTLRISVRPSTFNSTLALGDIVRVRLRRETNAGTVDYHDYFYEVERLEKNTSGIIQLDLIHFPVDSDQKSIVAQAVVAATAVGTVLPTGRNDLTCHTNTGTGNIADDGISYPYSGFPAIGTTDFTLGVFNPSTEFEEPTEVVDPLDEEIAVGLTDDRTTTDPLKVGDTVTASGGSCVGGRVCWYRRNKIGGETNPSPTWGVKTLISCSSTDTGSASMTLTSSDVDYYLIAEWSCPDPSSADGFGTPYKVAEFGPVEIDPANFTYARWKGTTTKYIASGLYPIGGGNFNNVPEETTTVEVTSTWFKRTNAASDPAYYVYATYLTITGGNTCVNNAFTCGGPTGAITSEALGNITYPPSGPIPWRASVKSNQTESGSSVCQTLGGIGQDANNSGCYSGNFSSPQLSPGGSTKESYWAIEGKWEFSNDESHQTNKSIDAVWSGRQSEDDGFHYTFT
tara:strand:- start:9246 stop:11753 length:2508 start_codon:yes stop_codon:yes gene_type:complete